MPDATPAAVAPTAPATNPAAPATPAEPVKAVEAKIEEQRFKVKVNGKEEDVSLSDMQKHYGTFAASQKALKESAEIRKQAEEAIGHLKSGTRQALEAAGLTKEQIRTIAIETLAEEHRALLEQERKKTLSPEQRELEEARAQLKAAGDEKKAAEDAKKAEGVAKAKQQITNAVIETLEQFPESVRRNEMLANQVFHAWAYCIEHPDQAKELGIEVSPAGIHKALVKRQRELMREMMTHAEDEELDEYLAPTVKGRLFKTQKAAAEAAAHPSLTGVPEVRTAPVGQMGPGKSRSKAIREITLGSLGLK